MLTALGLVCSQKDANKCTREDFLTAYAHTLGVAACQEQRQYWQGAANLSSLGWGRLALVGQDVRRFFAAGNDR